MDLSLNWHGTKMILRPCGFVGPTLLKILIIRNKLSASLQAKFPTKIKTKKSFLKDKLKSADIVILVKSKAHHGASKAVAEFQNQFGFAFAVANTLSMGQFEDALYRASNGLPADITSMDNLH